MVAQINDILHKRIKIFAAQNSMKISEVIEKAFDEYEKNFNEKKEKDILWLKLITNLKNWFLR